MNISINDLPDDALLEILYRLDCYKFVTQCKRVSKRWCNLMSHPSFIGGFVRFKSAKPSPIKHSLLHRSGEEFLGRLSSSTEPLTPLFDSLMSRHAQAVGFINETTSSAIHPQSNGFLFLHLLNSTPYTRVGFICDLPFYDFRSSGDEGGSIFHLNAEYRYRVVRLVCPEDQGDTLLNELRVQIFSSETGAWTQTVISSPMPFCFHSIDDSISYTNKGMLYWGGHTNGDEQDFLIGINPFTISSSNNTGLSSTSSSSINDHINFCFIALRYNEEFPFSPLGVYKGCMRIYDYDLETNTLCIVDLNDEEIYRLRLDQKRVYRLNEKIIIPSYETLVIILGFDPDDDNILYLVRIIHKRRDILKCNIPTGTWSTVAENTQVFYEDDGLYTLAVPWWPTPVRMLPPHSTSKYAFRHTG